MADVMNGFVVVYLNLGKNALQSDEDIHRYVNIVREINKDWIDRIEQDAKYKILFVPTIDESSRVERMVFSEVK
jgi:hypothetical protein